MCPELESSHHLLTIRLSRTLINRRQFLRKQNRIPAHKKKSKSALESATSKPVESPAAAGQGDHDLPHAQVVTSDESADDDDVDTLDVNNNGEPASVPPAFKPGYVNVLYYYIYTRLYIPCIIFTSAAI